MPLTEKQRGVIRGVFSGAVLTLCGLGVAVVWNPEQLLPGRDMAKRLVFSLQWDVLLVATLAISIGSLGRHRFFSVEDIDGGGLSVGTQKATTLQAILQNTLEQVVLGVLTHTLWAVTMPLGWQAAIPVAALLFLLGRILFLRGYSGGAPARALGFAITFYPSVLMLVVVILRLAIGALTSL